MKKKNYEEVKNIVESQGSILLSKEYINNRTSLDLICECGEPFSKSFDNMKRYDRYVCNECSDKLTRKNRSIPYNVIKRNIEKEGYKLVTKKLEYVNTETKLVVLCSQGHSYEVFYNTFISGGKRCRKCYNQKTKERLTIPYKEIKEHIESIGYFLLTKENEYVDTKSRIEVVCDKGHKYPTRANTIRSGKRCRKCSNKIYGEKSRIPYEQIIKAVEDSGYKLLTPKEEYTVTHKKYIFQCDKGHEPYKAKMAEFLQGTRCPICNESKGEKSIVNILDKCNIKFQRQFKFDDCKLYHRLPFDFYLPDYNLCIEYDGKQHFEIVNSWGGFDGYVSRCIRDSIKNIYCRNNNIGLLRIPYFKFDEIENILVNKLKLSQDNTELTK